MNRLRLRFGLHWTKSPLRMVLEVTLWAFFLVEGALTYGTLLRYRDVIAQQHAQVALLEASLVTCLNGGIVGLMLWLVIARH